MKSSTLFTGSYGLVIKPDEATQRLAENLSRELFPKAEYQVTVPHITLYHGKVTNLPVDVVLEVLEELRQYQRSSLNLFKIDVFGGKFAFWDVQKDEFLTLMHHLSLKISRYLDRTAIQRSLDEGLEMSLSELENVKRFGHPLVNEMFRPHITLAYDSRGLGLLESQKKDSHKMVIDEVLFAEMGKFGSVARVIEKFNV